MLGKTCSGEDICYIESRVIDYNSAVLLDLSSTLRVGFTGNDSAVTNSNTYLTLSLSETKELGSGDLRKEGFYLGVDLSQVILRDISLGVLPDICNNNYEPYQWELKQKVYKNDGTIEDISLTPFDFNLAKQPEVSTTLSNISIGVINPTLTSDKFYGLSLPTDSTNDLKFTVDFSINNLHPIWAPSNADSTASLFDVSLIYDPTSQTSYSNGEVDRQNSTWVPSGVNTSYTPTIPDLMVDYTGTANTTDYNNFKYSRDISGTNYGAGKQFQLSISLKNNVTLTPTISDTYSVSNDLSGNGKPWWWDFTWGIPSQTQPPSDIFTLPSNTTITLMETVNPFTDISKIPIVYNHTTSIDYSTSMWAKDGWFGDNSANNPFDGKEYPYIDFSSNFYNPNSELLDYSIYDNSGVNYSYNYGSFTNTFNTGSISITETNLKWVVFKLYRSTKNEQDLNFDTNLTWGTDYILFYLEEDVGGSNAYSLDVNGTLTSLPYTYWVDVQNVRFNTSNIQDFANAQTNGTVGENNGANSGSTGTSTKQIKRFRTGDSLINQYLAFGLRKGAKLKTMTFSYS